MQSDRDLLKQALEALDAIAVHGDVACVVAPEKEFWLQPIITALRKRLAQPEQEPCREWVGLTEEEKRQLFEREDYQGWLDYINAIEAKLKEKNA